MGRCALLLVFLSLRSSYVDSSDERSNLHILYPEGEVDGAKFAFYASDHWREDDDDEFAQDNLGTARGSSLEDTPPDIENEPAVTHQTALSLGGASSLQRGARPERPPRPDVPKVGATHIPMDFIESTPRLQSRQMSKSIDYAPQPMDMPRKRSGYRYRPPKVPGAPISPKTVRRQR